MKSLYRTITVLLVILSSSHGFVSGIEQPPPVKPEELGPWGRRWSQYEAIVWFYGGPGKSTQVFDVLRSLDMTGSNVGFMNSSDLERTTGFHFYVGDASQKGILHLKNKGRGEPGWDMIDRARRNRNDYSALVRPYCLHDPATLGQLQSNVKSSVSRHNPNNPVAYALGDEISTGSFVTPVDVCYGPHTMAAMRKWLKEKYGSLEKLNSVWGSDFKDWNAVMPMTADAAVMKHKWFMDQFKKSQATRERAYPVMDVRYPQVDLAQWNDHRTFMDITFASVLGDLAQTAHAIDRDAPVGGVGLQDPNPWGGFDYARLCRSLEWLEAYDLGEVREINRSFLPRSAPVVQTHFVRNARGQEKSNTYEAWYYFAHGDRGVIIWSLGSDSGVIQNSLAPTPGGLALAEAFKAFHKDDLDKQIFASEFVTHPIGIYYSQPSIRFNWVVDAGANYETWPNRSGTIHRAYSTHIQARRAFIDMLENSGYQYKFISYLDVLDKGRVPDDISVLILPKTVSLSQKEADVFRKFVEEGGTLIADQQTGMLDENLKGRTESILSDLFGIRRSSNLLVEWFDSMSQHKDWDYGFSEPAGVGKHLGMHVAEPGIRESTAVPETRIGGVPVILTNNVGKGRAVYLNLCVQNYNFKSTAPDGEALRKKLETIVSSAGIPAECKVFAGDREDVSIERIWYKRGKWRYLFLIKNGSFKKTISGTQLVGIDGPPYQVKVVFPAAHEVVNVRTGKVFGDTGTVVDAFTPWEASVYRMWVDESRTSPAPRSRGSSSPSGTVAPLAGDALPAGAVEPDAAGAYTYLRGAVKGAAESGAAIRVTVEFAGMPMRGTLKSLDDRGLVAKVAGNEITVSWKDLRPVRFYEMASRAVDDTAEAHMQLAHYCLGNDMYVDGMKELWKAQTLGAPLKEVEGLRAYGLSRSE
ncbi:MAG: beta-galactosidase trimerization domain-containing protein [Planctomycetes bacterium]|nr:beta-galactosidase trimerization domain-containing protein [Planctomycetota bacterium]